MIPTGAGGPALPEGVPYAAGQPWLRARLVAAAALFSIVFALLIYGAWLVQVRDADRYGTWARWQHRLSLKVPPRRGRILDRNGAELAASVEVDSVYSDPARLGDALDAADQAARRLAPVLSLDRHEIASRILSGRRFAWIKRHVTPEEARAVRQLDLPGIALAQEPRRFYPNRSLAGALLGWAGIDGAGADGIERAWDAELGGAAQTVEALRDALGQPLLVEGAEGTEGKPGRDVVTTIDKFIQYRLERALEAGVEKHRARAGAAVALDPRTGEVLAMASVPRQNPNDPDPQGGRNRVILDPYEPGSTMKTFSIAAGVEAGLITTDETWNCENGRYPIGRAIIHDAEPIGIVTTTQVLAESSNICTAKMARRSGKERVEAMLRRFGFGRPTGVDLPGERSGILRPSSKWGEVELATIAFGQGVTATPLQVAAGYAAIAGGGVYYRPHVVRRVVDAQGNTVREVAPEGERALSEDAARTMRDMLGAVVAPGGTAEKLRIPGYPAAGKTGTAQKVDPQTRRYSVDKWASSFVGFAPTDDPRLVILVVVDEPQGAHYGSAVAGPIWREVMVDALRYLNVRPIEEEIAEEARSGKAPIARTEAPREGAAEREGGAAPDDGGRVDVAAEPVGDDADDGQRREVPRFVGLAVGQAVALARRAGVPIEVAGSGVAVAQDPPPGARAPPSRACRVTFGPAP